MRRLVPAIILVLALVSGASAIPPDPLERDTLRLSDLPRGWIAELDRPACALLDIEGASPALRELVLSEHPRTCVATFRSTYDPKAPTVTSGVLIGGAERAFAILPDLFRFLFGLQPPARLGNVPGLGDRSVVLTTSGPPGTVVAWRSGVILAYVFVAGPSPAELAVGLARREQKRIARPTPVLSRDFDDRLVPLDDPRLDVPVYWLGKAFAGAKPAVTLTGTEAPLGRGQGPGHEIKLDYGGQGASVTIGVWRPRDLRAFRQTELGRLVRTWPCTKRSTIRLPRGHAEVYAGLSAGKRRPCPRSRPNVVFSYVYLPGAVVTINVPNCIACIGFDAPSGYNTVAGMTTLVHALRRR